MNQHTFIIRIVRTDDRMLRGQLTNPLTQQQLLFTNAAELWQALLQALPALPPASGSPPCVKVVRRPDEVE